MSDPKGELPEPLVNPPLLPTIAVYDDEPERKWTFQGVLTTLLVVMMVVQMVYLITYAQSLRVTQDVLVCEAHLTHDLRDAARIERRAMQALLSTAPAKDPNNVEERQRIAKEAISLYNSELEKAITVRERIGSCPALPES